MNYKLIAVDLDDSLLGSDLQISARNREALTKAMEKGVWLQLLQAECFTALVYRSNWV